MTKRQAVGVFGVTSLNYRTRIGIAQGGVTSPNLQTYRTDLRNRYPTSTSIEPISAQHETWRPEYIPWSLSLRVPTVYRQMQRCGDEEAKPWILSHLSCPKLDYRRKMNLAQVVLLRFKVENHLFLCIRHAEIPGGQPQKAAFWS